jgi:hypothetical protein
VAVPARCQRIVVAEIVSAAAVLQRVVVVALSAAEMEVPLAPVATEEARAWVVAASAAAVAAVAEDAGDKQFRWNHNL